MIDVLSAAQARAAAFSATDRGRASRPQQRASHATGVRKAANVVSRAEVFTGATSGDALRFDGTATVYEAPYDMADSFGPYSEVVSRGAGANSLARAGLDVPLVLQHDSLRRIASTVNGTLQLVETQDGLQVSADLDPTDHDVQYIVPKLRSGLVTEMSFRFSINKGVWNDDYTVFRIDEYDIHRGDVAIVGYGANPATTGGLAPVSALDAFAALAATGSPEARAFLAAVAAEPDLAQRIAGSRPAAMTVPEPVSDAIMALLSI